MRANIAGVAGLRVLRAIAAGRVTRDDVDGTRPGMWSLYVLDGDEVGMTVRRLGRLRLVDTPLLGPPTITPDGWRVLRDA
ncbi:MAG: hypothetical protein QOK11_1344 [Pseudonocardiales bacterium]|nr:hypothetical protein [Pseudonocardiales bacterium]